MASFTLPADSDLAAIGFYNVLDHSYPPGGGMIAGGGHAVHNTNVLQNIIAIAISAGGGTIFIPDGTYDINGPISVNALDSPPGSPVSLTIMGTDGSTTLNLVKDGPLFIVATGQGLADTGITFKDFQIQVDPANSGVGILVSQGENIRVYRMIFTNCQVGIEFDDASRCSVLLCTFKNDNSGPPFAVMILLGNAGAAKDISVVGSRLLTQSENQSGGRESTGLAIKDAEDVRIVNTRIEAFRQAIVISGPARRLRFTDVTAISSSSQPDIGAALNISPAPSASVIDAEFVGCHFGPPESGFTLYEGAGVFIDEGEGTVDQVRFLSCYSAGWAGPGVQIIAGSNIEILGGFYSCNGTLPQSPPGATQAGIVLAEPSGEVSGVRIFGVGCTNTVYGLASGGDSFEDQTQEFGVSIGDGATDVTIRDCDLTGNLSAAVTVSGSAPEITDCAGYNDQALVLPSPIFGTTFTNSTLGYFGPIAFYVWGDTPAITIDGHLIGLQRGGFTLAPGESAKVAPQMPGAHILVIGQ